MTARRWSGDWARDRGRNTAEPEPDLEVLIPTVGRVAELAVTLAGLAAQDEPGFGIVISDQSEDGDIAHAPAVAAMIRVLQAQSRPVRVLRNSRQRGMAEQRQFLLDASSARQVLFLDDDVWCEPGLLARMASALTELGCGFVGSAVQGLSYLGDERPAEHATFTEWRAGVEPEQIRMGTPEYDRVKLHNAANLTHIAALMHIDREGWLPYRVAWIGGCVLFDREALVECGGFTFWPELPAEHSGEDVVAQWRVMERFGGAGILPSGAVHLEAPTTVTDRRVDAPEVLPLSSKTPVEK